MKANRLPPESQPLAAVLNLAEDFVTAGEADDWGFADVARAMWEEVMGEVL